MPFQISQVHFKVFLRNSLGVSKLGLVTINIFLRHKQVIFSDIQQLNKANNSLGQMRSSKPVRNSFSSSVNKPKENHENTLYISQYEQVIVNHAELYQHFLLLCAANIYIYDIQQMVLKSQIKVQTHTASFIPFTNYLCYPDQKETYKMQLVFWNYQTDTIHAKVTFDFIIEEIRTSRRAITLTTLEHLYVIHFPSLKPIYEDFAGNGIRVIFDASKQGLTLAHSTEKKGEVKIRNFTNIQTNKLLIDLQSRSKIPTFSRMFRERESSIYSGFSEDSRREEIKKEFCIKAHNENIALIRLSPNGYRVVTASIKGTVIRMYSCLKEELISEFRMGYQLSLVVDIQFNAQATQIVCLNDVHEVALFHARMSEQELLSQSARKGHQIYQQRNPTSFFSFLSFLNRNLNNQFPSAYFKVNIKKDEIESMKQKLQSQLSQKKQKEKMAISQIKQVHESHLEEEQQAAEYHQISVRQEGNKLQQNSNSIQVIKISVDENEEFQSIIQEHTLSHQRKISLSKKHSISSQHRFKSLKSNSPSSKMKPTSSKSAKLGKKQAEFESFGQRQRIIYLKGIVGFGSQTNIKVLQGSYYFQLKYDPFNGGHMVEKKSFNLLKHQLFSTL